MSTDNSSHVHSRDGNAAIRRILEGTATEVGEAFFGALVKSLAKVMDTKGAWVTEYLEESQRLRMLAYWLDGQFTDPYEYDMSGTPCGEVIDKASLVHFSEKLISLFPDDPDLEPFGAESYIGVPLVDIGGEILGHLAVQDTHILPADPEKLSIMRIFAARASAELQRLRAEKKLHEREEKLGRLIDSAMDAIVELDERLKITRINPATEKVFNCTGRAMNGRDFSQFLSAGGRARLAQSISELNVRPEGERYLWIPGGLTAICPDGKEFLAEATLSRYEMGRQIFYNLILRNVNERIEAERKIQFLRAESDYLKEEIRALQASDELIGKSKAFLQVLREVQEVAETDATVLIQGETGTGKEVIARAIHRSGRRRDKPLIKVNCAAIPPTLIESEFFGHEKGAFTGATVKRDGRFAIADGGTIFLDEIGELPVDVQTKLLRVLHDGEFESVGSSATRRVDVRVIAATNRDLRQEIRDGRFREDLFYRLNVFPITVPPLRERGEDIVLLASAFGKSIALKMGRTMDPILPGLAARLRKYTWPGNVRELQNVIERAVITSRTGQLNLDRALPELLQESKEIEEPLRTRDNIHTMQELQTFERNNIIRALEATDWTVSGERGAASLLGMHPSTLSSRMKALGIKRPA